MILGGGLAGAIKKAGTPMIQTLCDAYIKEKGNVMIGDAGYTQAKFGTLQCDYIIHAVGPIYD